MLRKNLQVAVIGGSEAEKDELEVAYEVGRILGERGCIVICGGRTGIMEAVCKGAYDVGGITVGILMTSTGEDANPYVKIKINTGMGHVRNPLVVASGEFVIAIGGKWGTLSELSYAKIFGKKVVGYKTHPIEGIENYDDKEEFLKRIKELINSPPQ